MSARKDQDAEPQMDHPDVIAARKAHGVDEADKAESKAAPKAAKK